MSVDVDKVERAVKKADEVMTSLEEIRDDEGWIKEVHQRMQAAYLSVFKPIYDEHIKLALNGRTEASRLRAIKLYYDVLGMNGKTKKIVKNEGAEHVIHHYMNSPGNESMNGEEEDAS
ncbi:MAG: hypothetical protein JSU64_05225 [candidate division WOR-3 bacterium]|nr:MAG: hypothetical protein JSU64_05225 [candidate division WOR-3 bacterium]